MWRTHDVANKTVKEETLDMTALTRDIESLKKRLTPDEMAKAIDHSYLSINNLRGFLQILSLVLTIFVAGAVCFGVIGVQNILKLQEKIERVDELENEVLAIRENVEDISLLFNKVAINNESLLNAREQQLLILLAREIDPNNQIFTFNAAHLALLFGRSDEAMEYAELVLKSPDMPRDVQEKARQIKDQAEKLKANPQEYPKLTKGPTFAGYNIIGFNFNTLKMLRQKGYLTNQEITTILNDSKSE